jgi:outer membrane lipoprotein SlyB
VSRPPVVLILLAALAGCGPDYSANTYNTSAVQQANKVERGVIVGLRDVVISSKGTTGAVTGAAVGGVAGSQAPGGGVGSALGAIGGTLLGGIVGSSVEQASADQPAVEYVVEKPNHELISVTQKDEVRLPIGQRVLVIAGTQARIVPDYTIEIAPPKPPAPPAVLPATLPPLAEPAP